MGIEHLSMITGIEAFLAQIPETSIGGVIIVSFVEFLVAPVTPVL